MTAIVRNAESVRTLQAQGQISIETPNVAQSASFSLALRKPDSLLIRLRGPFGINVGWLFATQEHFTFYNALENQLVTGPTSQKNLERILHANLAFADVLDVLSGKTLRNDDLREPDEQTVENNQPVYVFREARLTRRYTIDEQAQTVLRTQMLDRNGRLAMEQGFANFQDTGATTLPFSIRILQPRERQFVSLFYSSVRVNEEALDFSYSIPSKAQRVQW